MFTGHWELLIIVALVFLLFGAKRVPNMMENLAKGITSFKKGLKDDDTKQVEEKKDA